MSSTTIDPPETVPGEQTREHRLRWFVLAVIGLAQLMVVLDATIVNIALPAAQKSLEFSDADRQWVVTAYALAFGSLLLLGGRLSDLFGRRNTFVIGLVGFAAMSAVGGAAVNFPMLVAARAGQGVFGALLAPAALSLLSVTFTRPDERAKAFGVFGAIAGAGGAVGLLLGGVLTEWASWRWSLYVNLVFAAVALVGAVLMMAPHKAEHRPRLDIPGTVTVSAGLFSIVYGFSHAESHGWSDGATIAWLLAGAVLLAIFVVIETRVAHPLLPLRVVLDRTRGGAYLAMFIAGTGMFAVFLFLTYYMQTVLQYSPVITGVAYLPMVAGMVISATTSTSVLLPGSAPAADDHRPHPRGGRHGPARPAHRRQHVCAAHPARPGAARRRHGNGVRTRHAGGGHRRSPRGRRRGLRDGEHHATGRWVDRHRAAQHDRGDCRDELPVRCGPHPQSQALAAVHGYTTTFWWSAAIFAAGAVISAFLLPGGKLPAAEDAPEGQLVMAH